ncbi:tetratricopeptide repeat protein, partial [candidate division NPL-UPA2 bacterium]|nr:tetratricopeptide repeat protein [candidate division NPL-UPA2 bacterium]
EWSNTYAQILLLFLLAVWFLKMTMRGEFIFQRTVLDIPILFFSLALVISLFGSVNRDVSFRQLYQFLSYPVLYFLIINNTGTKLTRRQGVALIFALSLTVALAGAVWLRGLGVPFFSAIALALVVIIAGIAFLGHPKITRGKDITVYSLLLPVILIAVVLVSLYGIYQHYWGLERTRQAVQMLDIQFPHAFMVRLRTHQVFSTFVFPPALAGYLVILLPLAITLLIFTRGRWSKVLPGLALATGVLCLYFTHSKGGWGIFIFSLPLLAFILAGRRHRRWMFLLFFVAIGLFLILVLSGIAPYVELRGLIASFNVRVEYWRAGLGMLRDFPLFGSGLGTFGSIYAMYKLPGAEETRMAHNNYLQIWTETGILGITSFLWLWGAFLRAGWKTIKDGGQGRGDGKRRGLVVGCYVGVMAFLIHSLVDFGFYVPGIATYVWLFMGMVLVTRPNSKLHSYAFNPLNGREQVSADGCRQVRNYKLITPFARIVVAIVIILATVFLMMTVRRPLVAERYFQKSSAYLHQEAVEEAVEYLNKAIQMNPRKGAYRFRLGSIYQRKGLLNKAISQYRKAIERDPFMPHYRSTLGKVLWEKARGQDKRLMEEAVGQFEKARDLFPERAKYRVLLGRIYELKGREEDALKQYERALKIDPSLEEVRVLIERLESR